MRPEGLPGENPPFKSEIGSFIGIGKENIVRELGSRYVVKEAREWLPEEIVHEPDPEAANAVLSIIHPASEGYLRRTAEDYRKLKGIFGDALLSTSFVRGYSSGKKGQPTNYIVQERIAGKTLVQLGEELYEKRDPVLREQFLSIVWGCKKALMGIGVPTDAHEENIVRDDVSGKLFVIGPGSPSNIRQVLSSGNEKAFPLARRFIKNRIERIEEWIKELGVNEKERLALDKEFSIDENLYQVRVRGILSSLEGNDASAKNI